MKRDDSLRRKVSWKAVRMLHAFDYAVLLPVMARLPLFAGYALSALRGWVSGLVGRDWRSVALETRHVARQSAVGYRMLFPDEPDARLRAWLRQRYETESREEFEGQLIVAGRAAQLNCRIYPDEFLRSCLSRKRGLLLLTPHFDSCMLGITFLGMAGVKINVMTSAITNDPRVAPAVSEHFFRKYRGMERMMNGGRVLNWEDGLQPFYQMLERGECLVVLPDAPARAGGVAVKARFLGARRRLAAATLLLSSKTGCNLGAFVCRFEGVGRYRVDGGPILAESDPLALDTVYGFLSENILASPGCWWAADLLPTMSAVDDAGNLET